MRRGGLLVQSQAGSSPMLPFPAPSHSLIPPLLQPALGFAGAAILVYRPFCTSLLYILHERGKIALRGLLGVEFISGRGDREAYGDGLEICMPVYHDEVLRSN